ncbi:MULTISPECIES: LysR family transcriptional regulator [Burkholderia]|uniref:LysR family transcriptional regulator n=1 Tax=Burkholderia TaxID=32008 RepID=UPI00050EE1F5|nr:MULTISPECIES: LysR family transcriptional regulator [Burkholderia]AYQ90348.1 LysR family transcriptional regulator [Burkholderia gladioli]KGE12174.1 LysR family transcriptional regulator [Burkholderia gladioli]KVM73562.1 LysR family transcriptional regulator [Burkholderia gladioli]NBI49150.1 LysR family transcriptional regulator [Burkholderia sp. ISTR5]
MDNLGDIRLFVEAANLGSLSAAGRKLGLSPAAASARLIKLEGALSTQLFERSTRKLRLTDEGRLYLAHCQHALQTLDDARSALQLGRASIGGTLRVSATSDFGRVVLRRWLDEFNDLHPQVALSLVLADSLSNLLHDDIDLAIRFGVPADSGMVAKRLADNRRVLCASPAYLAAHGAPRHPEELGEHRFVLLSSSAGVANQWKFSREGETVQVSAPLARARQTNDGALAREWAIEGRGAVMKSIWDVGADLRAGRLVMLLPEWRCPEMPVHALFQRSQYLAPRVRALLDFLQERFGEAAEEIAPFLR